MSRLLDPVYITAALTGISFAGLLAVLGASRGLADLATVAAVTAVLVVAVCRILTLNIDDDDPTDLLPEGNR